MEIEYDVFISHSSLDRHIAFMLCEAFEKQELKCWIAPRNVKVGLPYAESIVEGIENSKAFVILFSTNSNNSSGVLRELEIAHNSQIPIVPLRIEDTLPTKFMKFYIMANHWIDALNPKSVDDFDRFIDELRCTINLKDIGLKVNKLPSKLKAQREKEEKLIFFNTPKLKEVYINREIDTLLSNRIAQKKGGVLFLHGQGGIGKTKLLEKFSHTTRPTIFIHINDIQERFDIGMIDIFLDDNKTTVRNCPKFEVKLDEINWGEEKMAFNAEFELLSTQ